ncbi:hypothetical protein NBC122_02858 [Chryseobacterium salivictor]|uniref:Uncharacterized protein n=1 Tax=Chryseobacterium salivictor TaxID=2547600 RepID=A0A4P6ZJ17_9FLAO|nr:hypothetical protein NBC122_02858 [Chryseobacterium salivictor]
MELFDCILRDLLRKHPQCIFRRNPINFRKVFPVNIHQFSGNSAGGHSKKPNNKSNFSRGK